jgi:SAM-dependent methyltransferase
MDLHVVSGIACVRVRRKAGLAAVNLPAPPVIFSPARRLATRLRMLRTQLVSSAPRYLLDDMIEDVTERIAFLRHTPRRVLAIGDLGALGTALAGSECEVTGSDPAAGLDQEAPYPFAGFDTVISLGVLDTANDLPGALIHLRGALAPGGLAIASFIGAGSLQGLREAMLAADGERPAPRLHPAVDVRAGGQLLQRAGWADPVVDCRSLQVRFSSLDSLVADLRAQGLSNCLADPGPPLTRGQLAVAREAFGTGRTESFEILTLTGWRR